MPCCERLSTSRISRVFFAVRSSNSLTLFTVGVTSLRTYFLEAQPTVSSRTIATATAARLKRFIKLGSLLSAIKVRQQDGDASTLPFQMGRSALFSGRSRQPAVALAAKEGTNCRETWNFYKG